MDPKATFKLLRAAYDANDGEGWFDAANDLNRWLKRGGFTLSVEDTTGHVSTVVNVPSHRMGAIETRDERGRYGFTNVSLLDLV